MPESGWFARRFEAFLDNAVFAIAVPLAGALVAAIALAEHTSWPMALSASVLVGAAIIVAINQLWQIDQRARQRRLARRTPKAIHEQIVTWLHRYHYTVTNRERDGFDFRIEMKRDMGGAVIIAMAKGDPWVTILAHMEINGDPKYAAVKRSPEFRLSLAVHLSQSAVDYQVEQGDDGAITRVVVSQQVAFDDRTTDLAFLREVREVFGAALLVSALASQAAQGNAQPEGPRSC